MGTPGPRDLDDETFILMSAPRVAELPKVMRRQRSEGSSKVEFVREP